MKPRFVLMLPCLVPLVALGSMGERPVLHVETYRSPSAKWQLEVDPTHREGSGKGNYRLEREGNGVWHAELPFTLYDAEVTDSGTTAGYAYSHGLRGSGEDGPGTLNAVIIDAKGEVLLNEAVKREGPHIPDGMPGSLANGILLHPEEDRFILRLQSNWQESWQVYQFSTGKKLDTIDLRLASQAPEEARFLLDARPITGLPLLLLHWWCYDQEKVGALFSIVDLMGRPVWSLELPEDYTIPRDEAAEDRLREQIRRDGGILKTEEAGIVEIRLVADGQRAKFKVERDSKAESGWTVTTVSKEKYQPPLEAEPKPVAVPPLLRLIDSFGLQDSPATGAVRDIQEFEIDGDGRFGFLRREIPETTTFVLVDSQAAVIAEVALPTGKNTTARCAWLGGSRWIVIASSSAVEGKARAWWLDAGKRSVSEIDGFECPSVEAVRGTSDGGFVVLASRRQQFSSTDFLIRFDALGKESWKHEASSDEQESSFLSPEDITVTSRKEIAVLDNIRHVVKLFGLDGAFLRAIDLEKAWKREPNYPSGITSDAGGGFIVYDFDGSPPFVRMRPDGNVIGEFSPRRNDGRAIDAGTGLRAAADGSLWACDGESFIQLSKQGVAIRDIGTTADDDKLGNIAAVTGDGQGNVYAVDYRTGVVHVFGPDGAKLRVCKPAKEDFTKDLGSTHITVTDDGRVFLGMEEDDEGERYLGFGPDGTRQGVKRFGLDNITEEWFSQPGTGNMLVMGYEAAFLVDSSGKLKLEIERQADRRWFENLSGAAFASDGSFVIHSTSNRLSENTVTFFTPEGAPLSTIRLQKEGFAMLGGYNGRLLTMRESNGIRVYDRDGKAMGTTPEDNGNRGHFLARGGKELWVVDSLSRKVERYGLPE